MQFWLGTHRPNWLGLVDVPLMVTVRSLKNRRTFPRARASWWQDSNGFTELSMYGAYQTSPSDYVAQTRRHQQEIGNLAYVSPQDWMCEPIVLQKTGLTIAQHQSNTIISYLDLMEMAPDIPWVPVLQGWRGADYMRHVEQYAVAGVDLQKEPLIGVGTVCRRQRSQEGLDLFRLLSWYGLRLHGFGVKQSGLQKGAVYLRSADSLAWSYRARRSPGQCPWGLTHKNCANCMQFALRWRTDLLMSLASKENAA